MTLHNWKPIDTAPQDGKLVKARGRDFGSPTGAWHYGTVYWLNGDWWSPDETMLYRYLTEWRE